MRFDAPHRRTTVVALPPMARERFMTGSRILVDTDGKLVVPSRPTVPVVTGVGASAHATEEALRRADDAVALAYGHARQVHWLRIDAGEASMRTLRTPVPDATVHAIRVNRLALLGALPRVEGDERTLETELVEVLDLYVGTWRQGATRLCWENRETSAASLSLEEGSHDAAQVQQALDEVHGRSGASDEGPGRAVSVVSRHGTRRLVSAVLAGRTAGEVAVLHAPSEAPAFLRWVKESAPEVQIETLSLSEALTRLLSGRPLPALMLSNAALAAQWLSVAAARPQASLSRELAHPETNHAVFLPLRDDLPEEKLGPAMLDATSRLLRRLGWEEAADELEGARPAKAS